MPCLEEHRAERTVAESRAQSTSVGRGRARGGEEASADLSACRTKRTGCRPMNGWRNVGVKRATSLSSSSLDESPNDLQTHVLYLPTPLGESRGSRGRGRKSKQQKKGTLHSAG
ncbi:hypothetical protein PMIN02_004930 [Paraphaeosphaeria minitans]